jgi:hypothetical protein
LRKTWLYPRWSVYKVATGNPFYKRKGCPHHRELYMGDVLADFSAGHHLHPHSHVRDCNACRRIPLIFLWMAKYHFAATILSEMGRSIFQHLAISFQTMCFPAAFHFQPLWPAGVQSTCHTSGDCSGSSTVSRRACFGTRPLCDKCSDPLLLRFRLCSCLHL